MNAGEVLEQFRVRAGFDAWCGTNGQPIHWGQVRDGNVLAIGLAEARPAWRDGDDYYALPDGWEWDNYDKSFFHIVSKAKIRREGKRWSATAWKGGVVRYGGSIDLCAYKDTAPDAFRAAEKWLQGNGGK